MCSMLSNSQGDECLKVLGEKDRKMIEKRMFQFASGANTREPGHLDMPQHHMKDMPSDLKAARKMTVGRHRVFWEGHHSNCSYRMFYVKPFKKTGTQDEHDKRFQATLSAARLASGARTLKAPVSE